MLNALVVDDEFHARENLRAAVGARQGWSISAVCDDAASVRTVLGSMKVDVAFIDVQMPGETGLELAKWLAESSSPPRVVFVSAYSHHAFEAFSVRAFDYLLKPVDDEKLGALLERIEQAVHREEDHGGPALGVSLTDSSDAFLDRVCIKSVGQIESIALDDLLWIRSAGNYVELHMDQRMVMHRASISSILKQLDPTKFVRIHRTIIVRRDQIAALKSKASARHVVTLKSGERVPVSPANVGVVRKILLGENQGSPCPNR